MSEKQAKWQEIANRGLQDKFDPETRAKFNEAVSRGLINMPETDVDTPTQLDTFKQDITNVAENLTNVPSFERGADVAAEGLAEGIGSLFGLPVDAVTSVLNVDQGLMGASPVVENPVGGSQQMIGALRGLFKKFGLNPSQAQVGNLTENLLQIGGASVAPGGTMFKGAKIADELGTTNTVLKNIAKSPKEFAVGEAAAVTSAGVGRTTAEQVFPESPVAGMIGELFGHPTAIALDLGVRGAKEGVNFAKNNLSEEGSLNKASAELQSHISTSKEEVLANIEKSTDTPISGGKQSNDVGLIERQRELDAENAQLHLDNQVLVMESLTDKLDSLAGETGGSEFIRQAKTDIKQSVTEIDSSINAAAKRTADELSQLDGLNVQESSRIARANLEDEYISMSGKETQLWDDVELDTNITDMTGVSNTKNAIDQIIKQGSDGREVPKDMIVLLKRFLFKEDFIPSKASIGKGDIGGVKQRKISLKEGVSAKTLQNMRSRILEEARAAAGGNPPDRNRAALLGELQEALIDDIAELPDVSADLAVARAHSKHLNDTFNKGKIGKLRGISSDGSLRVDPDLTLSKLISANEESGVNLRNFLDAESSPQTIDAIGDYVQQLFLSDVAPDGKVINTGRAKTFLNNYKHVLDRIPDVRTKLNRAIDSGDAFEAIGEQGLLSKKAIEGSALKSFLNIEDPARAIAEIRRSKNPSKSLQSLVDSAKKDQSGNALEGLKSIVAEDILSQLQTKQTVAGSTRQVKKLSNAKAQSTLKGAYRNALEETGLYDSDQLTLIDSIVSDIDINDRTVAAKLPGTSGTSQDILGNKSDALSTGFKFTALRFVAPLVGKGPGSLSAAGKVGSIAERLGRKIGLSKTNDLVRKALTGGTKEDKELLKILVSRIPDKQAEVKVVQKLRGYLISLDKREKERLNQQNVQFLGDLSRR